MTILRLSRGAFNKTSRQFLRNATNTRSSQAAVVPAAPSSVVEANRPVIALQRLNENIHNDWLISGGPGTGADHASFRKIDLSFDNIQEAYKSKSNFELARAVLVYRLCSIDKIVDNQRVLLSFAEKVLGKKLLEKLLRLTFYGHFVAGADTQEIKPVIQRLFKYGVKSILDYSVEDDLSLSRKIGTTTSGSKLDDQSAETRRFRSEVSDVTKGVYTARTYLYEDEERCDKNVENFIKCIDAVSETTQGTGFAAIKVTALGRPALLMHVSEVLIRIEDFYRQLQEKSGMEAERISKRISEYQFRKGLNKMGIPISRDDSKQWFTWLDTSGEGKIDIFEWSNLQNVNLHKVLTLPSMKTFKDSLGREYNMLMPAVPDMDEEMDQQFRNMINRLNHIVEHAEKKNVRLMIDAEQTYFQPAINRLAMEMMRKFNKEQPVVFNTYQAYLKGTLKRAQLDMALAAREDFYFGCKLVRGAYIEQERARAVELNYDDPTCESTEKTTENYVRVFEELLHQAKQRPKGKVSTMLATHNEESVRLAVLKMKENGINPDDKIVCFGQLMGMCDHVSFPLGQAGFSVYKYVPYGPTFDVLPYLMRRAQENRGIFDKAVKERRLLSSELTRRILRGQLFHSPD